MDPKLAPGALIVADNMTRGSDEGTEAYAQAIRAKPHLTTIRLEIGCGLDLTSYTPA